jgi:hypothetical protein
MLTYLKNLDRDDLCLLISDLCGFAMLLIVAVALITLAP